MFEPQRRRDTEASDLNVLSGQIVDCAFAVHKNLGPGLLESIYQEAMVYELEKRRLSYAKEKSIKVPYETIVLPSAFRLDLIIEDQIIVELKCVERIAPIHEAQLLTYLKITNKKLGLLFNFNSPLIKDGIRRVIL